MKIFYHKRFLKRLKKCSSPERELVAQKVEVFSDNPFDITLRNHQLHHPYAGHRSIDIKGDLVALYAQINTETAEFRYLGTHHELYGS